MRKWGIGLLIILLACGGGITLLVRNSNGAVEAQQTATVRRGDIADAVVAIGSVQPDTFVEVKAKVSGIVEWLGAEAGDTVTQGQVLVELDKDILRGHVAEAEAGRAVAKAALAQAEAEYEVASAERDFQQAEYKRSEDLRQRGLISSQQLESAGTIRRRAAEQYKRAHALLQQAKARLQRADVSLQLARDRLSFTTLRSPMDGVLLSRPVEIGSAVADITAYKQAVFTVGDMTTLILDAEVDETEVGRVRLGMIARIQLEAFQEQFITGRVTRIAPKGFEENHIVRFNVEITLDPTDLPLRAQLTGDAEIIVDEHPNTLLLDERAIQYDFDGPFTLRPPARGDGEPDIVRLKLGFSNGRDAEVLDGLREGDEVLLPSKV